VDTLRHQGLGDRSGAGTKLDDRTGHARIDVARHDPGERPARRRHRAHRQRLLEPGADEADLVVEADAAPFLEAADADFNFFALRLEFLFELPALLFQLVLDLALERVLLPLEDFDVAPDLALPNALFHLEQALLFFEFSFQQLQGGKRHRWNAD